MVKTKKLQKNLGKGLLAGALEKPEVPDTIKFKKHFKKLVSVALSAVMVMILQLQNTLHQIIP